MARDFTQLKISTLQESLCEKLTAAIESSGVTPQGLMLTVAYSDVVLTLTAHAVQDDSGKTPTALLWECRAYGVEEYIEGNNV